MRQNRLDEISWYLDDAARARGEPGISHSYIASLATALHHMHGSLDPAWLMGSGAFAFRINVSEVLCPSAMSVFSWVIDLPAAVEQAGYVSKHISRLWDEDHLEEARRAEAHSAILSAIDRGAPAVVWDVHDTEWGLVTGYDNETRKYSTLTHKGQPSSLSYDRLGRNGIDILSVIIPGEPNQRTREQAIRNSLNLAIAHAEGREWTERPAYQNGLAAYDLWATVFDRWALLVEAGKAHKLTPSLPDHAAYYAQHYYSARCYARNYLHDIANGSDDLLDAFRAYARVAVTLRQVWDAFPRTRHPNEDLLRSLASSIRSAKTAEQEGLDHLRRHLSG